MKLQILCLICLLIVNNSYADDEIKLYAGSQQLKLEVLVDVDSVVWGFDFIDSKNLVFTTRSGEMYLFDLSAKKKTRLEIHASPYSYGQGGLLDVLVHKIGNETWIYYTYSKKIKEDNFTTALAREKLVDGKLVEFADLYIAKANEKTFHHYGSRLAINGKYLFMTVGERGHREKAQDLTVDHGKILRLNLDDGTAATGNPYESKNKYVWTYGHRNPQGIAFDSKGILFEIEFGPKGGDEINIISAGKNYGWPIITYGEEYVGGKIGEGVRKNGLEQPITHYTPSISPSGANFYKGNKIAAWKDNLFLACLSGKQLRRLELVNSKVKEQEKLLSNWNQRIRFVRMGPDEFLYLSTDSGKIARILPK